MHFSKFLTTIIVIFLIFLKASLAKDCAPKDSFNKDSYAEKYFDFDSISPLLINKPFKINSLEHKKQIKEMIILQNNIDIKNIDLALKEKQLRPETIVQNVYKSYDRNKFPHLYKLLDRVGDTSRAVTDGIKNYWKIPRPYVYDKDIQILISPSKGYSYPSGHATGSYIYAFVMGLLIPQKYDKFYDYATQLASRRVQVGMHYPQDLIGGKQLAIFLMGGLMQNTEFQADFKKALEELKEKGSIN